MLCRDCFYFLPSERANQRAVLEGYGYRNGAPSVELRARFFHGLQSCWLPETRFLERKP